MVSFLIMLNLEVTKWSCMVSNEHCIDKSERLRAQYVALKPEFCINIF